MPLPPLSPESDAYTRAVADVRARVLAFALAAYAASSLDDAGAAALASRMVPVIAAAQVRVASLTASFLARQTGSRPLRLPESSVVAVRGVDPAVVYERPVITTRAAVAKQIAKNQPVDLDKAREVGARRLDSLLTTDLQMSKIRQADASLLASGRKQYMRVPRSEGACALCLIASTQRYWVGKLLPIHPGCQCGVAELPSGTNLDGNVIDADLLNATHAKVKEFAGIEDRGGRAPDYRKLLITRHHGELGDVLAYRDYKFTGPAQIAQLPRSAAELPVVNLDN